MHPAWLWCGRQVAVCSSKQSSRAPTIFLADEPENVGGLDSGPGPYELLLAALGTCTMMTLRLYADRQQWPLKHSQISLRHNRIYALIAPSVKQRPE
jgi:uncharacterized OsmC-like protein